VRVAPTLVSGYVDASGTFRAAPAPAQTRVVSAATAKTVTQMIESVVSEEGTAPMVGVPGYVVAGKTGTAQRYDVRCHGYCGYTASFVGFAPADSPKLIVACTLQNPVNGHFGGRLCGPVFNQVMSFALQTMKIPPTGAAPTRLPLRW